jgi:hypothetical protein
MTTPQTYFRMLEDTPQVYTRTYLRNIPLIPPLSSSISSSEEFKLKFLKKFQVEISTKNLKIANFLYKNSSENWIKSKFLKFARFRNL